MKLASVDQINYELVPILDRVINDETVQTVNLRDLHEKLESKQTFPAWVKDRIIKCRLVENTHYIISDKIILKSSVDDTNRGRPKIEYYAILDAAKHIAMMEGNDRGFMIRDYFIQVEKDWRRRVSQPAIDMKQFAVIMANTAKEIANTVVEASVRQVDAHINQVEKKVDRLYNIKASDGNTYSIIDLIKITYEANRNAILELRKIHNKTMQTLDGIQKQTIRNVQTIATVTNVTIEQFINKRKANTVKRSNIGGLGSKASARAKSDPTMQVVKARNQYGRLINAYPEVLLEKLFDSENIPYI